MRPFKYVLSAALFCAALFPTRAAAYEGDGCNHLRWDVKTLTDAAAAHLSTQPHDTTVAAIVARNPPDDIDLLTRRIGSYEYTLWRVRVLVRGYRLENDGDIHVLMEDPTTHDTMIGEIPNPNSACAVSAYAAAFARARATLAQKGGGSYGRFVWLDNHYRSTPPMAQIEGYGLWDPPHARDAAANGAELHPITSLQWL